MKRMNKREWIEDEDNSTAMNKALKTLKDNPESFVLLAATGADMRVVTGITSINHALAIKQEIQEVVDVIDDSIKKAMKEAKS